MKKILIVFLSAYPYIASAQTTDAFRGQMQHTFRYVDPNKVTTGLLYDYGLMLTNVEKFNGSRSDSNRISFTEWQLLYTSLYSCRFNGNAACRESVPASFG